MNIRTWITGRRQWAAAAIFATGAASLSWQALPGSEGAGPAVEDARALLEKWVETRRVISQERRDWALGHELLADRIEIVQREIEALQERIKGTEASIAEAEGKRVGLLEENDALRQTTAVLADRVGEVEGRTAELLRRVPSPLQERVRPLSQQFPEDPAETKLTLSQRFQNVIGSLNAVNKFNREITVTSEVRTLGDGTAAEVTALYIGIGQGFYVNALATAAGTGSGVSGDWAWEPNDAAAPLIATAIAVFKNEQGAEFVRLPMHIAPRKGSSR